MHAAVVHPVPVLTPSTSVGCHELAFLAYRAVQRRARCVRRSRLVYGLQMMVGIPGAWEGFTALNACNRKVEETPAWPLIVVLVRTINTIMTQYVCMYVCMYDVYPNPHLHVAFALICACRSE
jgi:hypothetical protein